MPYIKTERRLELDPLLAPLLEELRDEENDGVINYCITRIVLGAFSGLGYEMYERASGLLECVKLEFYRRAIAPYEDKKCKENGDVYK